MNQFYESEFEDKVHAVQVESQEFEESYDEDDDDDDDTEEDTRTAVAKHEDFSHNSAHAFQMLLQEIAGVKAFGKMIKK